MVSVRIMRHNVSQSNAASCKTRLAPIVRMTFGIMIVILTLAPLLVMKLTDREDRPEFKQTSRTSVENKLSGIDTLRSASSSLAISSDKEQQFDDADAIDTMSIIHDRIPMAIHEKYLSKIKKITIVISHCDLPLNWISRFIQGFENKIDSVWVFTKCDKNVTGAPQNSKIIKLPNVGRCDHTYAHWMSNYYSPDTNTKYTTDDIVLFMKDAYDEGKIDNMLTKAALNGLGCLGAGMWSKNPIKYHDFEMLKNFRLNGQYTRLKRDGIEGYDFYNDESYSDLGKWLDYVGASIHVTQNLAPVCYKGQFAVVKSQINNQPKHVWERIEKSLSRADNLIEGHFAERSWALLLEKSLADKTASAIWALKPQSMNEPDCNRGHLKLGYDVTYFS